MTLPVKLSAMEAIPEPLREKIRAALAALPSPGSAPTPAALASLERALESGRGWIGADPSLAAVGAWLVESKQAPVLRELGCAWLGLFPTSSAVTKLAALAAEKTAPYLVREAAIRALGDRELCGAHPSTTWTADAATLADEALARLADAATAAGRITSDALPLALRHVNTEMLSAIFAKVPALWAGSIESFATAPLARVLFVALDDLAAAHRTRLLRLIAHTLGEEAVPLLVTRADVSPAERHERLLLAVALGGEKHLPALEDAVRDAPEAEAVRTRARWHLQHRGVIPMIRALRGARTLGMLASGERGARARAAADDFAAAATFERFVDAEHYAAWASAVRASDDGSRSIALVAAHPPALSLVGNVYLGELARRGRVDALAVAAHELGAVDQGALLLATWGRPLAALELAATARDVTPALLTARALASYRAGRPDLALRVLAALPGTTLADILALAEPAPIDADLDRPTFAPVLALEAELRQERQ